MYHIIFVCFFVFVCFLAWAGFGLGGSSVALFARVGGGIYTKAADVGADLVGKVEAGIPEDDPRNPATIADNVGDNVGDIAGMGADLFGSFAESTCAALVLTAQSPDLYSSPAALGFPLIISAVGIAASLVTTFFATHCCLVVVKEDVEASLKRQLVVSTAIMTPLMFLLSWGFLGTAPITLSKTITDVMHWHIAFCLLAGLWSGLIIGFITEYFTSHSYSPVREVADSCKTGAATNIIFGLALGYKSTIIPVFCIAGTIYLAFSVAGMYGIAMAALGILSTLPVGLTIDAYGPISDNAGGIAEMAHMGEHIREHTDALDAAGNTTAAIGKGFAIGSAAFVSLALFGAFVNTIKDYQGNSLTSVDILRPFIFAGLLVGAMLPYWFSAMTMKSVGLAAGAMVEEVRKQFREIPGLREGAKDVKPNYARCVGIATTSALAEMIAPGCMVIFTPIITGFLFGHEALCGVLVGALVSGVQIAISASNTGGAWDNAKKVCERGYLFVCSSLVYGVCRSGCCLAMC
jgi:H(+)-translocating pyrophosphatase